MNGTDKLLEAVLSLTQKEIELFKNKKARGGYFNAFDIMHVTADEAAIHSSFIAAMLKPDNWHGLRYYPLTAFLEIIKEKVGFDFSPTGTDIRTEYFIGPLNKEGNEDVLIDILLKNTAEQCIVIENKIYAQDQKNQLLRHKNFTEQCFREDKKVLYLTLYRTKPSEESLSGMTESDYQCISYKKRNCGLDNKVYRESRRNTKREIHIATIFKSNKPFNRKKWSNICYGIWFSNFSDEEKEARKKTEYEKIDLKSYEIKPCDSKHCLLKIDNKYATWDSKFIEATYDEIFMKEFIAKIGVYVDGMTEKIEKLEKQTNA